MKIICVVFVLLAAGCGNKPVSVEVKDICAQPEGTSIIVQGYLSMPDFMERISYRKGNNVSILYTLFLMAKPEESSESVQVLVWGSTELTPNKIKLLPEKYTWNDLVIYTDDSKTVGAGKMVRLTGKTQKNERGSCDVNVEKIESL